MLMAVGQRGERLNMAKRKYLCVIQARMGSKRLPGKILLKVNHITMLEYLIKRVRQSRKIDKIIIATSQDNSNDKVEKICKKVGVSCFRGSEDDVLDRYYKCSLDNSQYEYIIRLTADNPLIDPTVIDEVITFSEKHPEYDYVSNNLVRTFPCGMDIEIIKRGVLAEVARKAKSASEREHVDEYILNNKKYKKGNVSSDYDWSGFRLTVDYKEDYEVIKFLIKNTKITDNYLTYVSLLTRQPHRFLNNAKYNFIKCVSYKIKQTARHL